MAKEEAKWGSYAIGKAGCFEHFAPFACDSGSTPLDFAPG